LKVINIYASAVKMGKHIDACAHAQMGRINGLFSAVIPQAMQML
jgi:hypothetical protein